MYLAILWPTLCVIAVSILLKCGYLVLKLILTHPSLNLNHYVVLIGLPLILYKLSLYVVDVPYCASTVQFLFQLFVRKFPIQEKSYLLLSDVLGNIKISVGIDPAVVKEISSENFIYFLKVINNYFIHLFLLWFYWSSIIFFIYNTTSFVF